MHRDSSKQPKANKETIKTRPENVRVTRSRAKDLGASISPYKPFFIQEPKVNKRMTLDDHPTETSFKHKRRAVLKDVTNSLDGSNVKASQRGLEMTKQVEMAVLVDVDAEKSKLAEDLSKIRMVESLGVSSKDGQVTDLSCHKFVDIDSQDHRLYAANMYDSFHVAELDHRPLTSYMVQVQQDICPSMRSILISWLVEVSEEFKLDSDTLYLAVNIIDRFLSKHYIERRRLQLLGVTCMLIASKYEEICAPRLEKFCFITDNTYTRQEVLSMEIQVLKFLHFRLSVPTTKTFLRRFIEAAQASDKVPHIEMESLANYLAELTLVEYSFLRFLPSLIAASAVFLARWTLDQSNHPWNQTLQHYTRYETPALKNTVLAMEELQLNTSGSTLVAIREKYNQDKFKRVATLTSPERVTTLFSRWTRRAN